MARYKPEERGQGYFLSINPLELFDDYSLERVISKFIDECIDISNFDYKYKNDKTGQLAISPKVKIKVILYSLSNGIISMRQTEKMLKVNHPGYIYLSGGRTMDHSTLCKFLNDFPNEIALIFSKLLYLMNDLGLVNWNRIMIDGTKVSSNASKALSNDEEGFKKLLKRYEELSGKLVKRARQASNDLQEGEISADEREAEEKRIARQKKHYDSIITKIMEYEKEIEAGEISPKETVNLTDRESKLLKNKDGYRQGYNVQAAFSTNDVIVDIEAVSSSTDKSLLSPMIEKVEKTKKENGVEKESMYLLDKGYHNPSMMNDLFKKGMDMYIPLPVTFDKHWLFSGLHDLRREGDDYFLLCKGGQRRKGKYKKKNENYEFRVSKKFCEGCPYKAVCWKKENIKNKYFSIGKAYAQELTLWRNYIKETETEKWNSVYNRRIGKEHNFHDLKSNNGLSRLHWRGTQKCNTISLAAAISYNLKKFRKHIMEVGWDKIQLDSV